MRHTSHVPASFLCAPQVCEINCIVLFSESHDPSEETKKNQETLFLSMIKTVIFVETDAFYSAFFDEYKVEKNGICFKYKS